MVLEIKLLTVIPQKIIYENVSKKTNLKSIEIISKFIKKN